MATREQIQFVLVTNVQCTEIFGHTQGEIKMVVSQTAV
jgi:hypothetical protein